MLPKLAGLAAEHWYFVEVSAALDEAERARLVDLLDAGPASTAAPPARCAWVNPRLGTISPWSSKATDIARNSAVSIRSCASSAASPIRSTRAGPPATPRWRLQLLHDRMTESVLDNGDAAHALFHHYAPQPLTSVDILAGGRAALVARQRRARPGAVRRRDRPSVDNFTRMGRNPTDVELMMFAQANPSTAGTRSSTPTGSIDGAADGRTLFGMIRETHKAHPQARWSPIRTTPSVIEGAHRACASPGRRRRLPPSATRRPTSSRRSRPTTTRPRSRPSRRATGSGGEIRDEGRHRARLPSQGRGWPASRCPTSHPRLRPVGSAYGKPERIASALDIMIEGPDRRGGLQQRVRPPQPRRLLPQLRAERQDEVRGYHKPIMIAGGSATSRRQSPKPTFPRARC